MSLISKLKKNSKLKHTEVLSQSEFFATKVAIPTDVPMLNVALSGDLDGGIVSGLTVLAGPSKHFKTSFALKIASAYLKADPEAIMMFYDSEFGSPQSYFETFDIPLDRVLHIPITNVEELKFDLVSQLENLSKLDKVIVVIDSIGNLASKKELDDALDEKSVADMSRAKALKGLFRMTTPYLTMKDIPLLAVNHTYKEIGLYPKDIVGGGTGIYYSADNIWIIGRRQNKTGTEVTGYDFIINVEKSRFIKEKSKIPISVTWEGGIDEMSGLLDVAMAGGFVIKPTIGWYQKPREDKKYRASELNSDFWKDILEDEQFREFVCRMYQIGYKSPTELDLVDDI
jgi:RecA/RadA recombinase|tara:strand:- start:1942 stop:2967 length:1026 start_codon:yes stop_codon:yes gene_type:complete